MFSTIFKFELSYWVKNPVVYVFGLILFSISFLTMWGMSAEANVGDNIVMMNSYYKINNMANMFALVLIFMLPAIIGNSVFRDFSSRMYTLLYSFPFTKKEYLGAKFLSAFAIVAVIVCLLTGGFIMGSIMPGVQEAAMLPFDLMNYIQLVFIFLLPNMLFFGAVVFALILYTRNIYICFIGVIIMVIVQNFGNGVLGGLGFDMMAALCDPTGDAAIKYIVRFWTQNEKNFNTLPIEGPILYNRIVWLCISSIVLFWSYLRFEFHQFAYSKSKSIKASGEEMAVENKVPVISLPPFSTAHSYSDRLNTAWHLSNVDFRYIILSWPFAAILFAGGVLVIFQQYQMGPQEGVVSIPTTGNMLRFPMFFFSAIVNLLTFLYAGVLIHRDKLYRMDGFIDCTPQPNWVFLVSKILGLVKMQFVLLGLVLIGGLIAQVVAGYYRFEIGHYLFELYFLQGVHFFAWACLALCIHSIFKSMYIGYFVLILIPVANIFLPGLADYINFALLKENLLQFNSVKGLFLGFDYSDFNGYGSQLVTYFAYKFYWMICSIGLLIIALLVWKRGLTFTWLERWKSAKSRCVGTLRYSFFFGFLFFIATGSTIYYQEYHVSKVFFSDQEMETISAENEKRFGHLEGIIQPKLCDVNMTMDIYPATKDFIANGIFTYVNKVDQVIDTIVISKSFKEQTACLVLAPHQVITQDEWLQYDVIKLNDGLAIGDSIQIEIEIKNFPNSFLHHNSRVISDGTYMTEKIIPRLGFKDIILTSAKDRKKYGLGDRKVEEQLPSDSTLLGYENGANNMGQINYECIISTSKDQEALTMGELVKTWETDGRKFAHFKSDGPIVNTISWLSGVYDKKVEVGTNQLLELYRHPLQDYNDEHFFNGLQTSLDYCSKWFGPLDFKTIRVVEFPVTEGTFATVHGNLMPYSESYFICDVHDEENDMFNIPFFVSAHEIAHAWWGHRVDPANVPGGRMISEGMADYLAMKATETRYDKDRVLEIRKRYHKLYLEDRANQSNETPLIHSSLTNEFLNYRKSSLVLYAMSEYLGEEAFNLIIANFESRYNKTEPPFATSLDLVQYIKSATPDSLQYLVHDYFETITLYDNNLKDVLIQEMNGQYKVNIDMIITKYRADRSGQRSYGDDPSKLGQIHSLPLNDYVDIGIYDDNDSLVEQRRFLIQDINSQLSIVVDRPISTIRIDPNYLLFDVNRDNDVWRKEA